MTKEKRFCLREKADGLSARKHRPSVFDLLAVGILAGAGMLLFLYLMLGTKSGGAVIVRVEGEEIARYDLSFDAAYEIPSGEGGRNLLLIRDGQACVTEANCPDRVCVRTGKIKREGQSIVCLPHKVVIEVSGGEENGLDAVAGRVG